MTAQGLAAIHRPTRRALLAGAAGLVVTTTLAPSALATEAIMAAAITSRFGDRPVRVGRVSLKLPPIAENGYSVPLDIAVDSPMTEDDHVRRVAVFSPRNPLPDVACFHLSPASGRAEIATRIRLAGSQDILAIAEMSDGSLWSGAASAVVTLAACVVL